MNTPQAPFPAHWEAVPLTIAATVRKGKVESWSPKALNGYVKFFADQYSDVIFGGKRPSQALLDASATTVDVPLPPLDEQQFILDFVTEHDCTFIEALAAIRDFVVVVGSTEEARDYGHLCGHTLHPDDLVETGYAHIPLLPAHWKVTKLKYVLDFMSGFDPIFDAEGEWYSVGQECVRWGYMDLTRARRQKSTGVPIEAMSAHLHTNDVLINSNGQGSTGRAAVFDYEPGPYLGEAHLKVTRPNTEVLNPYYLAYMLNTELYQEHLHKTCVIGSTGQIHLRTSRLGSMDFPLPPIEEQEMLVNMLRTAWKAWTWRLTEISELETEVTMQRFQFAANVFTPEGYEAMLNDDSYDATTSDWKERRLKFLARLRSGIRTDSSIEYSPESEDTYPFLRCQNIHSDDLGKGELVHINPETHLKPVQAANPVLPDDILVNVTGMSIGRMALVPDSLPHSYASSGIAITTPDQNEVIPEFLLRQFESDGIQQQIFSSLVGASRDGLTLEALGDIVFNVPSLQTQQQVLDYINSFDTDMASLKVAVGELRDSIFKWWLSYIDQSVDALYAQGYDMRRIKTFAEVMPTVKAKATYADEQLVSFVRLQEIGVDGRLADELSLDEIGKYRTGYTFFEDGDVLIPRLAYFFTDGRGCVAEGLWEGVGCGPSEIIVLRPSELVNARYLFYFTRSTRFREQGIAAMEGGNWQKRVKAGFAANYRMPLVTLESQTEFVRILDQTTSTVQAMSAALASFEGLLDTYKQTVLTAVITGQQALPSAS